MPPKKSAAASSSKSKKSSNAQPTLSFKSRKPSVPSPSKKKSTRPSSTLQHSVSASDLERPQSRSASPAEPTTPTLGGRDVLVPESEDEQVTVVGQSPENGKRRRLDVKSKKWDPVYQDAKVAMGKLQPIHAGPDTHNNVHHILRVFDMTSKYGPCVGMTRLQRWERAKTWGLNPPDEIREILTTTEGENDVSYRENVLHDWV